MANESYTDTDSKLTVSSESLIDLIKNRPCLWNKSMPSYKNKSCRDAAWRDVYRAIDPNYDSYSKTTKRQIGMQINKKWCNLRDAYVKARNNYRLNKCNKPYIHAKLLTFIDPFISERQEIIEERLDSDGEVSENWYNEAVYLEEDQPSPKRAKIEIAEREDNSNLTLEQDNVVALLTRMIQREEDEVRSFFKSIEPSVRELSEESKLEFKIEVLKLIKNLKFRDKTGMQGNLKMSVDED